MRNRKLAVALAVGAAFLAVGGASQWVLGAKLKRGQETEKRAMEYQLRGGGLEGVEAFVGKPDEIIVSENQKCFQYRVAGPLLGAPDKGSFVQICFSLSDGALSEFRSYAAH